MTRQIVRTVATAIIAPLVVAAVVAVASWLVALQVASAAQKARADVQDTRIEGIEKQLDRIEGKLDQLLARP